MPETGESGGFIELEQSVAGVGWEEEANRYNLNLVSVPVASYCVLMSVCLSVGRTVRYQPPTIIKVISIL